MRAKKNKYMYNLGNNNHRTKSDGLQWLPQCCQVSTMQEKANNAKNKKVRLSPHYCSGIPFS